MMSEERNGGLVMTQRIDTPMTLGENQNEDALLKLEGAEELEWLMSLALDGALDEAEAARLEELLQETPQNMDRWEAWQALDNHFHQIPCALPPADFAEKCMQRLEIRERQRRLRTGIIFGIAAVALWGSALAGMAMLGVLAWSNQGTWLSGLVYNMAYWWTALRHFGEALWNAAAVLWSAPQARAMLAVYLVAAVAILGGWFVFLRRSTREVSLGEPAMVEA